MKKHLTFLFLILSYFSYSQSCTCEAELDALYNTVLTLNSYKSNLAGKKYEEYKRKYEWLRKEAEKEKQKIPCFLILAKLLEPVTDNSVDFTLGMYDDLKVSPNDPFFREKQVFFMSEFAKYNIKSNVDTDSIEKKLRNKPESDIEGIYYKDKLKVGLYRTKARDSLAGVILESDYPNWKKGDVAFVLYEKSPNHFTAIHSQYLTNQYYLQKNEKYLNGRLAQGKWSKSRERDDILLNGAGDKVKFDLKLVTPDIQYVRLGYLASVMNYEKAEVFLDRVQDSLKSDNVIIDLRENSHGSEDIAKPFLKFLKKYSRKHDIYIIINAGIKGAAERLVAELKGEERIHLLGEETSGILAYGYGDIVKNRLACGNYFFHSNNTEYLKLLKYEGPGISPDYILNTYTDWVEQTITIIKNKHE